MGTTCYAMVRGSAIRVTGLGPRGDLPDPIQYAVSKSVAKVTINEVTESGSNEALGSEERDDDIRLRLVRPEETLFYTVDIDFLRTDPGVLALVAGVPLVYNGSGGFGVGPFGEMPFGDSDSNDVVGFDSETRRPAVAFALEVWSKIAQQNCLPGERQWGYTLLPFLKGGYVSGVTFSNGLASFSLKGAKARRVSRWGTGPYDLSGPYERLLEPVSRNTMFRTMLTTAVPPTEQCGIQQTTDVIEGGTATVTSADVIDGEFVDTSAWIVEGGRAL